MKDLIEEIAKQLVDEPENVSVRVVENGSQVVFTVTAAKKDIGKIIGKGGKTVSAIRHLVAAIGRKHRREALLEIDDSHKIS